MRAGLYERSEAFFEKLQGNIRKHEVTHLKKLLKFFKGYGKKCALGPLFKLLEASFELMIPLVVAKIVDEGIAAGDQIYVMKMCLVMISLGIIGMVCAFTAQYYAADTAVTFSARVQLI